MLELEFEFKILITAVGGPQIEKPIRFFINICRDESLTLYEESLFVIELNVDQRNLNFVTSINLN